MAFEQKYVQYGLAKVVDGNVYLYYDQFNYFPIYIGNAVNAMWAGNELNVFCANGEVRRYDDVFHYVNIY